MGQLETSPVPTPPVAARLREAQAAVELTNDELARQLGVTTRLLNKWRAGDTLPRYQNLVKLAEILGRPVAWFYGDGDLDEAA